MKILIDADGCPVISIVELIAKKLKIEVTIVVNIHHRITSDYCKVIQVDEGRDVADFKIVNLLEIGDIVVTQDYGLAAMVLARKAYAINQNGMIYNNDNMEVLLMQRFVAKKEREKGNRVRGAKKRTAIMDKEFHDAFIQLIQKIEGGGVGID